MKQASTLASAMAASFDALSVGTAILRDPAAETTLLRHWCAALNSALKGVAIRCPDSRRPKGDVSQDEAQTVLRNRDLSLAVTCSTARVAAVYWRRPGL
jgi:hypothetical protein